MPFGYSNAATLGNELDVLEEDIKSKIAELKEFSPFEIYLLMNGTDHQLPQTSLIDLVPQIKLPQTKIAITLLTDYLQKIQEKIKESNYPLPLYNGEFRSSERAPLLQDTYSARMWIKQWDNKVEDLLVHYSEPMNAILHMNKLLKYPTSYLTLAWKWLLKNQPHDSICGCSVDQTHDEMIARYSWAESIADTVLNDSIEKLGASIKEGKENFCLVFNPTNNSTNTALVEFQIDVQEIVNKLITEDGQEYQVQALSATEEVLFENTFRPAFVKTGLKMLPGRKLIDVYINAIEIFDDVDPAICNITMVCDKKLIGELDIQQLKEDMLEIVNSGKYKKFHVKATLGSKQTFVSSLPVQPWSYNKVVISKQPLEHEISSLFKVKKNFVENDFYSLQFNADGSFNLFDKKTKAQFRKLHVFEDLGDKGDEYTFSKLGPERAKITNVHRKVVNKGSVMSEIIQQSVLTTFGKLNKDRTKRVGKTRIKIETIFRFYSDNPRIDVTTTLTNTAEDHRLRICFNLPFDSDETITSTHFGFTKRQGEPIKLEKYAEIPSGIQAQKRFIRIDNDQANSAFSLFNKGLPEVELVDKNKLALTLIRAIGFLSRQDFPERPMHAGPFLATPGAQELYKEYTFKYSILTHGKNMPINETYNQAESFALPVSNITFTGKAIDDSLTKPILELPESMIKISSMRIRDGSLVVTLYNLDENKISTEITTSSKYKTCTEILIDGTEKTQADIKSGKFDLTFKPFEIKMIIIR